MRTLITILDPDLIDMLITDEVMGKLEKISEVDFLRDKPESKTGRLADGIAPYEAVISGWTAPKLTSEVLSEARNLKFVGHAAGTLVPFIDISAYERGIRITNANRMLAASTAELTMALMMSAAWKIPQYLDKARKGTWSVNERETLLGLEKQSIGLIGLGEISRKLIELLKPFHPEIYLFSNHCSKEEAEKLGIILVPLEELLRTCSIISVHATLTPSTRGIIGHKELSLIRNGALLINTARAPIIDEEALVRELRSGRIAAALDVFNEEPLPPGHILLHLPNVVCSPHIGGFSEHWKTRLALAIAEDLERWTRGKALVHEVSREQYLRQTPQ